MEIDSRLRLATDSTVLPQATGSSVIAEKKFLEATGSSVMAAIGSSVMFEMNWAEAGSSVIVEKDWGETDSNVLVEKDWTVTGSLVLVEKDWAASGSGVMDFATDSSVDFAGRFGPLHHLS